MSSAWSEISYNLIHNAIRHTQPGGIIVVSAQVEHEQILLQVKDTGEGIAAEELPRIWERFYRVRNSQAQIARAQVWDWQSSRN